jgi:hypothetical protein
VTITGYVVVTRDTIFTGTFDVEPGPVRERAAAVIVVNRLPETAVFIAPATLTVDLNQKVARFDADGEMNPDMLTKAVRS